MSEDYTYHDGEWIYTGSKDKQLVRYEELKKKKNLTPLEKHELKLCEKFLNKNKVKKKKDKRY